MSMEQSTFQKFIENGENRRIYEQERLLVDATELLSRVMEASGTKRGELAERLGRSKAFVTQILRGNRNLTLRTLADVFYALDHRLVMVAEPFAASGLIFLRQWTITQHGNNVVSAEHEPSKGFYGGVAA